MRTEWSFFRNRRALGSNKVALDSSAPRQVRTRQAKAPPPWQQALWRCMAMPSCLKYTPLGTERKPELALLRRGFDFAPLRPSQVRFPPSEVDGMPSGQMPRCFHPTARRMGNLSQPRSSIYNPQSIRSGRGGGIAYGQASLARAARMMCWSLTLPLHSNPVLRYASQGFLSRRPVNG
jgi:hypothetical protein